MASNAVNARTFANYIVSLCTYYDGTALSSENKTQLYDFLVEDFSDAGTVLNVKTALAMLNKLYRLMTGSIKSVTVSGGNLTSALSVNSAKQLVNVVLPSSSGYRAKFITLAKVFPSTTLTSFNCIKWTLYLPAASSFGSPQLSGTLIGGGGGGEGGIANDGNKGSNYYTRSGCGSTGGTSTITLNGDTKQSAAGGGGAVSRDAGPSGGSPNWSQNGLAGSTGSQTTVNFNVVRKQALVITPGYGGGGGGGFGCTASTSEDYRAYAINNGINATDSKGGTGCERNSFTGEDEAFGGGGGEGGHGTGYSSSGAGTSTGSGPENFGTRYNGTVQSSGIGGSGGYTTGVGANTAQPTTMGAGGYGGLARNLVDQSTAANGGNGGNCGGFVVATACAAASALFIFR